MCALLGLQQKLAGSEQLSGFSLVAMVLYFCSTDIKGLAWDVSS